MPDTKNIAENAQRNEATTDTVTVAYQGIEFEIPQDAQDWPAEALLLLEDDKPLSFVRELVGPDAFAKIRQTKPTVRQYGELADKIAEAAGLTSGN